MDKFAAFMFFIMATIASIVSLVGLVNAEGIQILYSLIFVGVAVFLWILFAGECSIACGRKRAEKKGKEMIATFVSYQAKLTSNGHAMYFIIYAWTDEKGVVRKGHSPSEYMMHEAMAFEKAKLFKIKALGAHSVVLTKPLDLIMKQSSLKESDKNLIICDYCGSAFDRRYRNGCPRCGASRNK